MDIDLLVLLSQPIEQILVVIFNLHVINQMLVRHGLLDDGARRLDKEDLVVVGSASDGSRQLLKQLLRGVEDVLVEQSGVH